MSTTYTSTTITCLTCSGTGIDPTFGDECATCTGTGQKPTARVAVVRNAASEKQVAFIESLKARIAEFGADDITEAVATYVAKFDADPTKRAASDTINGLKAILDALHQHRRTEKAEQTRKAATTVEPGFYTDGEQVAKVQQNRQGDRTYAKLMNFATGEFEYTGGLIAKIGRDGWRKLTVEEAAAFGHLYGRCCCCGRTLTNEGSIEAGIGPICASKL